MRPPRHPGCHARTLKVGDLLAGLDRHSKRRVPFRQFGCGGTRAKETFEMLSLSLSLSAP
jgi:hypothetical protein